MIITCWSVKGGSGVSVVSAALASLEVQRHGGVLLVDLGGDQPAVLGLREPSKPGVLDWCASDAPAEALGRLVVQATSGLGLLCRGEGPMRIDVERAGELAEGLARLAPIVVVDAGVPLTSPPESGSLPDPPKRRLVAEHLRMAGSSVFVTRSCYLSLRRAMRVGIDADGIVVLGEPGRALDHHDVAAVLGLPVLGVVEADPAVSRALDAGTLSRRLPASLRRGLRRAG